jgi:hypothetical protein
MHGLPLHDLVLYSSKNCHTKHFGTVDLRSANLPHRDDYSPSRPQGASPLDTTDVSTKSASTRQLLPNRKLTYYL